AVLRWTLGHVATPSTDPVAAATAAALAAGIGTKGQYDCPPYNAAGGHAFTDDIAAGRYTAAQCNVGTPAAKATSLESGLDQAFTGIGAGSEFAGTTPLTLQATITALKA